MSDELTLTLIYNPLAGPADMATTVERVGAFWQNRGWTVTIRPTQYAGHAVVLAQEAAEAGRRLVLAAGGDGTLGEVANGLAHSETVLGPLPIGTGNSFGKELRMPRPNLIDHRALVEAAALLATGRIHRLDLGRFEGGKFWMLWTGTGVDSFIVDRIEPRSKLSKRLGSVGYAVQALAVAPRFPAIEAVVDVDGQRFAGNYLMIVVSNCRRYAGGEVLLNPDGALDDGLFEVILLSGQGLLQVVRHLWQLRFGNVRNNPQITVASGRRVTVETGRPIPVHTDGDPAGQTPFTCRVEPGALRLLVPRTTPEGLFSGPGMALR